MIGMHTGTNVLEYGDGWLPVLLLLLATVRTVYRYQAKLSESSVDSFGKWKDRGLTVHGYVSSLLYLSCAPLSFY